MKIASVLAAIGVLVPSVAAAEDAAVEVILLSEATATEGDLSIAATDAFSAAGWTSSEGRKALANCVRDRGAEACAAGRTKALAVLNVYANDNGSFVSGEIRGTSVVSGQKFCQCDVSDVESLKPIVKELIASLVADFKGSKAPSTITVSCDPADAALFLNGSRVSPGKHEVLAGEQEVRVSKPGYVPQTLFIRVESGVAETVSVVLEGVPKTPRSPLRFALGGAGVATILGGVYLIAVDQDTVVDNIEQPVGRNSAKWGYGAIGAGALMVGGAIVWHLWPTGDDTGLSVAVVPARDGAWASLMGRF